MSHPKSWTPEQVQNWLVNVDKKKFEKFSGNVPKATDGAMLVDGNVFYNFLFTIPMS